MNELVGKVERQNSDRYVDEKDPTPVIVVGDPASEHRSNRRSRHNDDSKQRKGRSTLRRRGGIGKDCPGDPSQSAFGDSLNNVANQQEPRKRTETTEEGRKREHEAAGQQIHLA